MITLFTVPRAFEGHINLIQRNALKSWKILKGSPQIVLIGNEIGAHEVCNEYKIDFIPNVKLNSYGTPFINDIFRKAQEAAKYDIVAFLNADIILTDTFIDAAIMAGKNFTSFLLVGQRYDVNIKEKIDFESSSWKRNLINKVESEGKLHAPCGIDYHVFRKGAWLDLPPFVIGRSCYDNWITAQSIKRGFVVIDCTKFIYTVHQNHGHRCLDNGRPILEGPEAKNNIRLGGSDVFQGFITHATWEMTSKGKVKKKR